MAVKTYRVATTTTNDSGDLLEADQTAASRTDGWTSAKLAAAQMAEFDAATKLASTAFSATAKPASFITGATCNAFSPTSPLSGTFAATAWTFTFALRCGTASAQRGRMRMRVFKATNAAGTTGVVELTGATQIGTTVAAALSTTADQTSVVTWSPGATIRLNNEYLFFVLAWEVTTAGGSNSCDVLIRTGQAAGGSRMVTPDFVPFTTHLGAVALPVTFGQAVAGQVIPRHYGAVALPLSFDAATAGVRTPGSLYRAAVLADAPFAYWRMDEASALPQDSSPSGLHMQGESGATVAGVPGLLTAPLESAAKARSFSASLVNRGGAVLTLNTLSIEFWVKRTGLSVGEYVLDQYNGGVNVAINGNGTISLNRSYVGAIATSSALKILDTNTHHVVITRDGIGGAVVFYLDGVAESPTPSSPNQDLSAPATNGLFIGSQWGNSPLDGTLDELAVYPTVLTPAQVANHLMLGTTGPVAQTHYGATSLAVTLGAATAGRRQTLSSAALSVTFGMAVQGQRRTTGAVALPVTFSKQVVGQRKTFGQVAAPITFGKAVAGQRKTFGASVLAIAFGGTTAARKGTFGSVSLPLVFGKATTALRRTFGAVALPVAFGKAVAGQRRTSGQVALPVTVTIQTSGIQTPGAPKHYGVVSLQVTFGRVTQATYQRKGWKDAVAGTFLAGEALAGAWWAYPIEDPLHLGGIPPTLVITKDETVPLAYLGLVGTTPALSLSTDVAVPQAGALRLAGYLPLTDTGLPVGTAVLGLAASPVALQISTIITVPQASPNLRFAATPPTLQIWATVDTPAASLALAGVLPGLVINQILAIPTVDLWLLGVKPDRVGWVWLSSEEDVIGWLPSLGDAATPVPVGADTHGWEPSLANTVTATPVTTDEVAWIPSQRDE